MRTLEDRRRETRDGSIQHPVSSIQYPASSITEPGTRNTPHVSLPPLSTARGFTLIELLVVIAVISLLAAMIFPITGAVTRNRIRSRTRTELEQIATYIEQYKSKLGHYPPDNPGNPRTNQLYFELAGTTNNGTTYITIDSSYRIDVVNVPAVFGPSVTGFVNSNKGGAGDETRVASQFLKSVKPGQIAEHDTGGKRARILTSSVSWPSSQTNPNPGGIPGEANPICYNSSNPTNNPNSYDLWVDVVISGKTNRISNWSRGPIIVGTP